MVYGGLPPLIFSVADPFLSPAHFNALTTLILALNSLISSVMTKGLLTTQP